MNIELRQNTDRKMFNILAEDPEFLREEHVPNPVSSDYTCDSRELDKIIYSWMEKSGWPIGVFKNIMSQVGLKEPLSLTNLRGGNYFECTDATGQKKLLRLHEAQSEKSVSKIEVIENNNLKIMYEVSPKTSSASNCSEAVTCKSLTYRSSSRYLEWFGDEWKLSICMKKLDEEGKKYRWHILSVKMEGLCYNTEADSEEMEARKESFNQYLLKARTPIDVVRVYSDMIRILYPDNKNYECIEDVSLLYTEEDTDSTTGKRKVRDTLGEYNVGYGDIIKYTVNDGGDIYTYELPNETDEDEESNIGDISESWICKSRRCGTPIIIIREGENYKFSTYGDMASMAENIATFREEFVRITKRAKQLFERNLDII